MRSRLVWLGLIWPGLIWPGLIWLAGGPAVTIRACGAAWSDMIDVHCGSCTPRNMGEAGRLESRGRASHVCGKWKLPWQSLAAAPDSLFSIRMISEGSLFTTVPVCLSHSAGIVTLPIWFGSDAT